jgi:hypothetical protein
MKLVDFANILEAQYTGKSRMCLMFWRLTRGTDLITDGIPNHYGKERQRHKTRMNTYGHSKLSRAPFNTRGSRARKKVSDGRPPDTKKELLGRRPSKATTRKKPLAPKKVVYQRSYPWQNNSCWLDSSLTAIFAACSHDPESLRARFTPLPENCPPQRYSLASTSDSHCADKKCHGGLHILFLYFRRERPRLHGRSGLRGALSETLESWAASLAAQADTQ